MKTCNRCGETKPLNLMVKSPHCKEGHRSVCKACMSKEQLAGKKARKARDAEIARLEALKQPPSNIAAPRTFNYMGSTYTPEPEWQRNYGNRHIPSRGFV